MYDPRPARFISEDPIGFDGGDTNLYRYVGNDPMNRIDPTGTSDMRSPWNGAVINRTNQPVYVQISGDREDHFEVLYPGDFTPNELGRSKDVDGVWVVRGNAWKYYPVGGWPDSIGKPPTITVGSDGCYYGGGRGKNYVKPWDGKSTERDPDSRGRPISNYPPDTRMTYPDASKWYPVKPEDKQWNRNGQEEFFRQNDGIRQFIQWLLHGSSR